MRRLLLCSLVVALVLPARASDHVTFEQITVAATAIGITSTITNPSGLPQQNRCVARLETAQIRYRTDSVAPTSTVGMVLEVGDVLTITTNEDARRIRFIRTGSTSGVLSVECYR
ncbi:MAG TPA: hypothetical protein VEA16_16935 [Vicinamibacterales bacterium]|nr:hypothetical protein [Vicinamibacterales bacterium]